MAGEIWKLFSYYEKLGYWLPTEVGFKSKVLFGIEMRAF